MIHNKLRIDLGRGSNCCIDAFLASFSEKLNEMISPTFDFKIGMASDLFLHHWIVFGKAFS